MTATWLDAAVERFGEPFIAFPEPLQIGTGTRRCWAFNVDGQNFNIAVDVERGMVHTKAISPGRRAELFGTSDPSDDEIRALCECAWPGYLTADPASGELRAEIERLQGQWAHAEVQLQKLHDRINQVFDKANARHGLIHDIAAHLGITLQEAES